MFPDPWPLTQRIGLDFYTQLTSFPAFIWHENLNQ
jgi:hypothetical protein